MCPRSPSARRAVAEEHLEEVEGGGEAGWCERRRTMRAVAISSASTAIELPGEGAWLRRVTIVSGNVIGESLL